VRSVKGNLNPPLPTRRTHTIMAAGAIATGYVANIASTATAVLASMLWVRRPAARLDRMQMAIEIGIERLYPVAHLIPEPDRIKLSETYLRWV
jgi:hypothetical protein